MDRKVTPDVEEQPGRWSAMVMMIATLTSTVAISNGCYRGVAVPFSCIQTPYRAL